MKTNIPSDFSEINISIGEIAKHLNITQTMLRIYEQEHIIHPERTITNRRKYGINEYELLKSITFMTQKLGVNINGVKIILSLFKNYQADLFDYIKILKTISKNTNINQEKNYQRFLNKKRNSNK